MKIPVSKKSKYHEVWSRRLTVTAKNIHKTAAILKRQGGNPYIYVVSPLYKVAHVDSKFHDNWSRRSNITTKKNPKPAAFLKLEGINILIFSLRRSTYVPLKASFIRIGRNSQIDRWTDRHTDEMPNPRPNTKTFLRSVNDLGRRYFVISFSSWIISYVSTHFYITKKTL